jgi:predicted ATPase/DNA-binding CsgD family transcriptional regulator
VWRVDLHSVADTDIADAFLRALAVSDDQGRSALDRILGHLAGRDLLLLLDGCEGVLAATANVVRAILAAAPNATVLATSREPLGVVGEVVRSLGPLESDAAVELFSDRAVMARSTFAESASRDVVGEICRRLDGIPLAIELAAARARSMSADAIRSGLDDRFRLLAGGASRTLARHATLLASIEWSYALLDESERIALRRLAVFTGGWTLSAAEHVVGWAPLAPVDVLDLLTSLVDKSLVLVAPDGRHRFSESVSHFALDHLITSGEADVARRRHLEHFVDVAARLGAVIERTADIDVVTQVAVEEANMRGAIEWAMATDPGGARAIAVALTPFWILRGAYRDARRALEPWTADAESLVALGQIHLLAMDPDAGFGMLHSTQGLQLAVAEADDRTQARALGHLGFVESYLGMESGPDRLTEARVFALRSADPWAHLWALGGDYWSTGIARDDHTAATSVLAEVEALGVRLDNAFLSVITDLGRGLRATRVTGNVRDATQRLQRALERCREIGEPVMEMFTVCAYAEALTLGGDRSRAREQLVLSERRLESSARGRSDVVTVALAAQDDAEGDDHSAHLRVTSALPAIRAVGAADLIAGALVVCGRAEPNVLAEALELARGLGNRRLEGDALACGGQHHEALACRWSAGLLPAATDSLEAVAVEAVAAKRPRDAAAVLAAAEAARGGFGWSRRPREAGAVADRLDRLRDELGDAFDAAWHDGAELDLAAAVRLATRGRTARAGREAGWGSLSQTETAVVELVATGLTNPEVATRLHMSRATVKTHLLHVFAKVGVASRAELAAAWATRTQP